MKISRTTRRSSWPWATPCTGAERDGGSSIAGFLRQWRKMVEDEATPSVTIPENTPGVHVLTMHQSKGLEFPAVIVPVNDSGGRGDDNLHWDQEGLLYINGDIAQAHPDLKEQVREGEHPRQHRPAEPPLRGIHPGQGGAVRSRGGRQGDPGPGNGRRRAGQKDRPGPATPSAATRCWIGSMTARASPIAAANWRRRNRNGRRMFSRPPSPPRKC